MLYLLLLIGQSGQEYFPLVCLLIFVTCGILDTTIKTGEYRYECIIDNSVSYNEVVENYNIIGQRGDIWILEDKQ